MSTPTPWTIACAEGNLPSIKKLLEESPTIANSVDIKGRTGLSLASRRGHAEVVKLLVPLCDVMRADGDGLTALHHSIFSFNPAIVERLLAAGGNPKVKDSRRATPLGLALEHKKQGRGGEGMYKIVALLENAARSMEVQSGVPATPASVPPTPVALPPATPQATPKAAPAPAAVTPAPATPKSAPNPTPTQPSKKGAATATPAATAPSTPATATPAAAAAAAATSTASARTPSTSTSSASSRTPSTSTSTSTATTSAPGSARPPLATTTTTASTPTPAAKPPTQQAPPPSPAESREQAAFFSKCKDGDLMGVVVALSSNPALASVSDSMGNTAVMAAARGGHVGVCRALVGKGGEVNASNKDGSSALTLAVRGGFPDLVSFLVSQGASITATDAHGLTSLHHAVLSKSTGVLGVLLAEGVSLEGGRNLGDLLVALDAKGNTALALATLRQSAGVPPEMVTLLKGAEGSAFTASCGLGDRASVAASLKENPTLHAIVEPATGFTPLIHAAMGHSTGVMEELVGAGADVNAQCASGRTALSVAAKLGLPNVVVWLLGKKASVHKADVDGLTPLHYAAKSLVPNPSTVVKALLKAGAKKDKKCNAGKTPGDYAKAMRAAKIHVTADTLNALK